MGTSFTNNRDIWLIYDIIVVVRYMIDEYLKIIYEDYYNINRTLDLMCDMDVIKFVYFLSQNKIKDKKINEVVDLFKNERHKDIDEMIHNLSDDSFFSARSTLHFTYPLGETLKRLDVLYEITGENLWKKIFGYSYDMLYAVITVILCRITMFYNYYRMIEDPTEKRDFEERNPLVRECYLTKEEIYKYFNGFENEINLILNDISVNYCDIKNLKDVYRIINNEGHYYLFFIWDFLYNLYGIYCKRIKEYLGDDKFSKIRGKAFENVCFKNLEICFPNAKKYKSLQYDYKKGNHEIDILMELEKTIVIFECKSGAFDIYDFDNDEELYFNLKKVFGKGYKTINDLNKYLKDGNYCFRTKNGKKVEINTSEKQVIYINLSLYNIEFLQTNIQKIKSEKIKKVDVYPICWNYIDFLTLTKVACVDYSLFEEYFIKRFEIINNNKNLTLDYDEVDVFGLLTDPAQTEFVNNYLLKINKDSSNIDMNFMISNAIYRKEFNDGLNRQFLLGFIYKNTDD